MQIYSKPPKTFPLRLPLTMRLEAAELARREGISLNQFVLQAVAEAVTRLDSIVLPTDIFGGRTSSDDDSYRSSSEDAGGNRAQ